MKISGAMVFYNEEDLLDGSLSCLNSFTDEIVVFDSFSTDKSVEVAEKYGCKIHQHEFDNHRDQKNRAIGKCENEWVFLLDADEFLDDKLLSKIQDLTNNTDGIDAFGFPRKNYLDKKGPRGYPDLQTRLFKNHVRHFGHPFHHRTDGNAAKHVFVKNQGCIIHEKTTDRQSRQNRLYYSLRPQDYNGKPPMGAEGVVVNLKATEDADNVNVYKDFLTR